MDFVFSYAMPKLGLFTTYQTETMYVHKTIRVREERRFRIFLHRFILHLLSLDKKYNFRSLVMIAKCLQNLANLVEFGVKESYMEVVNPFILKNKERMVVFLDHLSVRQTVNRLLFLLDLTRP